MDGSGSSARTASKHGVRVKISESKPASARQESNNVGRSLRQGVPSGWADPKAPTPRDIAADALRYANIASAKRDQMLHSVRSMDAIL
jgi:hypothetical protein